ncbi:MAG: potassium transporter Kup [Gammaproteobacteria bacterium]|nr:potassium transporter Kup [Gammaproteobacteria bacterium]
MISPNNPQASRQRDMLPLMVGAMGVVYGDIGTSPLYAMKETFGGIHAVAPELDHVFGILSLIFWALVIVVSLKYVAFIMRADNKGEGGIMALIALTQRATSTSFRARWLLASLGLFGAALFYGDGMITPAISVLSAVEGLQIAAPALEPYIIPVALAVLVILFLFQRRGTAGVGALFGPVMGLWFTTLAVLGIVNIVNFPQILAAVNPAYAVEFFLHNKWQGFLALGTVVLAVTGAEALYADMGHFGKKPIQVAWFFLVLPALLLNYFGQGALLIHDPSTARNPFFMMAPSWALYPLIALATAATVIASQAVISGAFSVTRQAIQLGYAPRMEMLHTSDKAAGQIYLPLINWGLLIGIVALVIGFESSSNLAAAYGVAVTGTMAIDTILAFVVVSTLWGWNWAAAAAVMLLFLVIDLAFFGATALKIAHGGWFPLVIAAIVFTILATWKKGREILIARLSAEAMALAPFLATIAAHPPMRVPGTAVFLTTSCEGVPHALLHNLAHNKVLHEKVIFLTIVTEDIPYVPVQDRFEVEPLGNGFSRIIMHFGFKDDPDVPKALARCEPLGPQFNMLETSFFLSRETLIATRIPGMSLWREKLFIGMARNASSAMTFFKIPTNRVIELGAQVAL